MSYLLDGNVFMAANNLHYGLDFCSAFWEWLIRENAGRKVFSIENVGDEIEAGAMNFRIGRRLRAKRWQVPFRPMDKTKL